MTQHTDTPTQLIVLRLLNSLFSLAGGVPGRGGGGKVLPARPLHRAGAAGSCAMPARERARRIQRGVRIAVLESPTLTLGRKNAQLVLNGS